MDINCRSYIYRKTESRAEQTSKRIGKKKGRRREEKKFDTNTLRIKSNALCRADAEILKNKGDVMCDVTSCLVLPALSDLIFSGSVLIYNLVGNFPLVVDR